MALIVSDISVPITAGEEALPSLIEASLGIASGSVTKYRIVRMSLDARKKHDIRFVYTVNVLLDARIESFVLTKKLRNVQSAPARRFFKIDNMGARAIHEPIVVVGAGPGGLFAAYILAKYGYKPLLIDRGDTVSNRAADIERFFATGKLNPESNVMFGEGGAGTFSDGKLTTRIKDERANDVLDILRQFGAGNDIAIQAKPHIGTDVLRTVVSNIREEIIKLGGIVKFNAKLTRIWGNDGNINAISISENGSPEVRIPCSICVLAIGQGARDTYEMLNDSGIELAQKPFAVGVRIEHPQSLINKSQYGSYMNHPRLFAAEYRVTARSENRGVYSFCMCPGGYVIASSSANGEVVTNGMSYHARDGKNANSAIVVSVSPEDFKDSSPLAGMYYQQALEQKAFTLGGGNYFAPCSTVGTLLGKPCGIGSVKPTYRPGVKMCDIRACMPDYIHNAICQGVRSFGRQISGFDMPDAIVTAIETRTSSPVRILRTSTGEATRLNGLYPVGEGAGYAGGIVSAAVDGIKAAQHIIETYAPPTL